MMVPFNIYAILVCTAWMIALGFLWFGPLFGKKWMETQGITLEEEEAFKNDPAMKSKMKRSYLLMGLGSLIMMSAMSQSYSLAFSYELQSSAILAGLYAGFLNWLGFTMPVTLSSVLWDNKTSTWFFITTCYYLVGLLVAGLVLILWV